MLLALALAFSLLPGAAFASNAAEPDLPDWYFLFAIFKNVDADVTDGSGETTHRVYTMSQEEVDIAYDNADAFEVYMNSFGVMRTHVDVIEIDETVTELYTNDVQSHFRSQEAEPFLDAAGVDLDKYDHVFGIISLNVYLTYAGMTYTPAFENGTTYSMIHFWNREIALRSRVPEADYTKLFVHEFLHAAAYLSEKFGALFKLHGIGEKFYTPTEDNWRACYTDIILNRAKGD